MWMGHISPVLRPKFTKPSGGTLSLSLQPKVFDQSALSLSFSPVMAVEAFAPKNPDTVNTDVRSEARQACYKVWPPISSTVYICVNTHTHTHHICVCIWLDWTSETEWSFEFSKPTRPATCSTRVWRENQTRNLPKSLQSDCYTWSNARNIGINLRNNVDPLG